MTPVEEFLSKYSGTFFRHSQSLIPGLRSGRWILEEHPRAEKVLLPCRHLQQLYELRYKWLDESDPNLGLYLRTARADALALCEELAKTPEGPVEIWSFFMAPYLHLDVFVGGQSQRLLGCLPGIESQHADEAEADEDVQRVLTMP